MNRVVSARQLADQFAEFAAVDVGQVVAAQAFLGERQQCLGDQLRAEEGAADADVDHVGDRLLGVAAPQAVVQLGHQRAHLLQDAVDVRHHVAPVHQHLVAQRPTQGRVQYLALLRGIDGGTVEHRLDGIAELGFLGQA